MSSLRLVGLLLLALSLPFAYIAIWRDVQFGYLSLPVVFFIFSLAQPWGKLPHYRFWRLFIVWLAVCTLVGFLLDQRFDFRQIKLLLALILCTLLAEEMAQFIRRSTVGIFIDAVIVAFTINLIVTIIFGYEIRDEISRASSFQSIGFSEYGLDEIGRQASFNEFGAMSGFCALLAVTQFQLHRNNSKRLLLYALLFCSSFYQVILTGSRSATVATLVGFILFCYLTRSIKLFVSVLFVIFGVFYFTDLGNNIINRFGNIFYDAYSSDAQSALGRIDGILDGLDIFADNPVFGVGYGGYAFASGSGFVTSENYFVQLLAESGLVGLLLFLSFLYELDLVRRCALAHDQSPEQVILISGIASGLAILVICNFSGTSLFDTTFMLCFVVFSMVMKSLAASKTDLHSARYATRSG